MSLSTLPVSRIMNSNVIYLQIPGNRETLLESIRTHHFSMFPVVDSNNRLKGIVGRKEILRKPNETQLSLLMSKDPVFTKKDESILDITKKMIDHHQSKIPVIDDDNKVIGIVSISDIIWKIIASSQNTNKVLDYYSDEISTVWSGTPANVSVQILAHSGQEALPVVDGKSMVGILSGNDLLKFSEVRMDQKSSASRSETETDPEWDSASIMIISEKLLTISTRPVSEIMTKEIIPCYDFSTIKEVAIKMRDKKIDQLPVTDEENNLLGLLTNWDVLGAFFEEIME